MRVAISIDLDYFGGSTALGSEKFFAGLNEIVGWINFRW
jgi:hypothetical protein